MVVPTIRRPLPLCLFSMLLIAGCMTSGKDPVPDDGPQYSNDTSLILPADYLEWPFIGSALGLTYEEESVTSQAAPTFTNAFVNPSSYGAFMQSGIWPDGTIFILEFRSSQTEAEPNQGGQFQGDLLFLEAEVKDSRFPDDWAFFQFGPGTALRDIAPPLVGEAAAPCVECHTQETAVERTFVQFYPTLLEVARKMGTLKPGF